MDIIWSFLKASEGMLPFALTLSFIIISLLIAVSFTLSIKPISKQFPVRRNTWAILIVIFLLGIYLRVTTPIFFASYYDDFTHMDVGKNIVYDLRPQMCSYGGYEKRLCTTFNEPVGFPYILAISFLSFGVNEQVAYNTNILLSSFLILVTFVFCYLLLKKEGTALYASLLISLSPLHILIANTVEPDTTFGFFILLTLVAFLLLFKIPNLKTGLLAIGLLAFSITIKQEGMLILLLVFSLLILFFKLNEKLRKSNFWLLAFLLIALITPHLIHLSFEVYPALFYGKITATAPGGMLLNFRNLDLGLRILGNMIGGSLYPWFVNPLAVLGVVYGLKKHRKESLFLMIFFLSFTLLYLSYSGGIVEKYLLVILIPLMCLGGMGVSWVEDGVKGMYRSVRKKFTTRLDKFIISRLIPLFIAAILLFAFVPYLSSVQRNDRPLNVHHGFSRDEVQYKEQEVIRDLDSKITGCYIVSENSRLFAATTLKGLYTQSVLNDPEIVGDIKKNGGCVFYFKDLFCTDFYSLGNRCGIENESLENCEIKRQEMVSRCEDMHKKFDLKLHSRYEFDIGDEVQRRYGQQNKTFILNLYYMS